MNVKVGQNNTITMNYLCINQSPQKPLGVSKYFSLFFLENSHCKCRKASPLPAYCRKDPFSQCGGSGLCTVVR